MKDGEAEGARGPGASEDHILGQGSRTARKVFVVTSLPVSRPGGRGPTLGWLAEGASGDSVLTPCPIVMSGPGFLAYARDFAAGTKLVINAEIQQSDRSATGD